MSELVPGKKERSEPSADIIYLDAHRKSESDEIDPTDLTDSEYVDLLLSGAVHPSNQAAVCEWIIESSSREGWGEKYDQATEGVLDISEKELELDGVLQSIGLLLRSTASNAHQYPIERIALQKLYFLRAIVYVRESLLPLVGDERWQDMLQKIQKASP